MIEGIAQHSITSAIHRLAYQIGMLDFLVRQGFDRESIKEQMELLKEFEVRIDLNDLLDSPFLPKHVIDRKKIDPTRYSDSTFSVFYGAMEVRTAKAEIKYHYARLALGDPNKRRTAYYMHFVCSFAGTIKDLRDKEQD